MAHPLLYEINTRCWLRHLSDTTGGRVTLANVPEMELEQWQRLGFTHIWLMGVWTGGPRSREIALRIPDLQRAYSEALPGWTERDIGGSPYAIAAYQVDPSLGGEKSLAEFRRRLESGGLKLMLDFVPNHLGLDHPWVRERPQLFVHTPGPSPESFAQETKNGFVNLAFGKDPNSAAWTDTVQLDYRRGETRAVMASLLQEVAQRCHSVRCDMAMLVLNDVFAQTWQGSLPLEKEPVSKVEFWAEAIGAVRRSQPGFEFLAEVYWGIEDRLQGLGFDYTYDKVLYDRLVGRDARGVQLHLRGLPPERVRASAHFLENHDEPRVASLLDLPEERAAALVVLSLPGMRFLHEGQLDGCKRRLPVQMVRRGAEPPYPEVRAMYEQLLTRLQGSAVGQGRAELLVPGKAWDGNPTEENFILVQWTNERAAFDLVVVNLAPHRAQCYAPVRLPKSAAVSWSLTDLLGAEQYVRPIKELRDRGLYLDVGAHGGQIFHFEPQDP